MSDFTLPQIDASSALGLAAAGKAVLIDLRKPQAIAGSGQMIRGAEPRNPFTFSHDDPLMADPLKADCGPLLVFCVHGHEVSQFACALLMVHGRDARYVTGGFEALKAAGAPLVPIDN